MSNKCEECGETKTWIFFGLDGITRECNCQVDLSGGYLFPWGVSSYLDECVEAIVEVLEVSDAK